MENQTTTPPVVENVQAPDNIILPPDFDAELDAVLSKSFPTAAPKQEEEVKKDEPKSIEPAKTQSSENDSDKSRHLEPAKADKASAVEKPALTPEQVDKMDPKEKGAWGAIKNANKNAHRMIEQRDSEITKLKAVIAERGELSQKEVEALRNENNELAKYRAMIDIQADPEFLSKFDQPIEKTISSIKEMLKGLNVSQDIIDKMDVTNTKLMDEVIGHVGEHADKFLARKLQRKVEELVDLSDKRDETLAEQKEKYKETLEAKKKQAFEKDAEGEGRAFKHLESVVATKDKAGNAVFPFLNKMEVKETATPPQIDQINAHNRMVDMMHQKVQQAYKMNAPEERMEVAVAAAAAHYLSAQLKASAAKIQALQDELQKIASVSSETQKVKTPSAKRNGSNMDVDDALSAHFGR